jgi:hypothetical protein
MPELSMLIREYCAILAQERQLEERKDRLRETIAAEMARQGLRCSRNEYGSAQRTTRFRLFPRKEPVLRFLSSEDLLPFANFTPARVKEWLVPKYGREALLPLFDIEKTETLVVKRPPGVY